MGAKFGNFSVRDSSIDEVKGSLKRTFTARPCPLIFDKAMQKAHPDIKPGTPEATRLLNKLWKDNLSSFDQNNGTYYIGENGVWITVFSERLDWGSAEKTVVDFSKISPGLCFSVSMFDSDIFTLTIVKEGTILTQHVDGDIEAYNTKSIPGDIDIIAEVFGIHKKKAELKKVLENKDLEDKVMDLEKLFGLRLWGFSNSLVRKMNWRKVTL